MTRAPPLGELGDQQ